MNNSIKSNRKEFTEYFLLLFLIATSGFYFFMYSMQYLLVGFSIGLLIFVIRKKKIDKRFWIILSVFLFIEILQAIKFDFISFRTFFGTYTRLFFAYFTMTIIGATFVEKYIKIIRFFSIISFVFYFLSIIFSGFTEYFVHNIASNIMDPFSIKSTYTQNDIIIFDFTGLIGGYDISRNSGPFWEPGAFGGFLIIASYFNYINSRKLFNNNGIIFLIAIITTFSTTAYIAYAFFIIYLIYFTSQKNKYSFVTRPILLITLISGFTYLYFSTPFLNEKITFQYSSVDLNRTSKGIFVQSTNRFGSAVKDVVDFFDYPFTGLGRNSYTRYKGEDASLRSVRHRNNGVTNFLATYGIIIFIMYFYLVFRGYKHISHAWILGLLGLILLIIVGFSENYFRSTFFYSLMFLFMTTTNEKRISKC